MLLGANQETPNHARVPTLGLTRSEPVVFQRGADLAIGAPFGSQLVDPGHDGSFVRVDHRTPTVPITPLRRERNLGDVRSDKPSPLTTLRGGPTLGPGAGTAKAVWTLAAW